MYVLLSVVLLIVVLNYVVAFDSKTLLCTNQFQFYLIPSWKLNMWPSSARSRIPFELVNNIKNEMPEINLNHVRDYVGTVHSLKRSVYLIAENTPIRRYASHNADPFIIFSFCGEREYGPSPVFVPNAPIKFIIQRAAPGPLRPNKAMNTQ